MDQEASNANQQTIQYQKGFSIQNKLLLMVLAVGIIPVIIMGVISIYRSQISLEKAAMDQLISIRELKKNQIENFFDVTSKRIVMASDGMLGYQTFQQFEQAFFALRQQVESNPLLMAEHHEEMLLACYQDHMQKALQISGRSYEELLPESPITRYLQCQYIPMSSEIQPATPAPAAPANQAVEDATVQSATQAAFFDPYADIHSGYHDYYVDLIDRFNHYDLFLIDADTGYVVYSAKKELDYATNLNDGPFADGHLAKVFRKTLTAESADDVFLVDFASYLPSLNLPSAFIATPIFHEGEIEAVLAFQISIETINRIMTDAGEWQQIGLGRTGESFLIGADGQMRNDARLFIENQDRYFQELQDEGVGQDAIQLMNQANTTILFRTIDTRAARAIQAGMSGTAVYEGDMGEKVIGAYTPLRIKNLQWGIIAEKSYKEASAPANLLARGIILGVILVAFLAFLFAMPIIRMVSRNVRLVAEQLTELATGEADLTKRLPVPSRDEVGKLANSFNQLMDNSTDLIRRIQRSGIQVTTSSTQIASSARQLESTISEQAASTNEVVATAKEISTISKDLSQTMQEVATSASEVTQKTEDGRNVLQNMDGNMHHLADATESISSKLAAINEKTNNINSVVTTITKVADQTNLLSLNAAIEAEKAGEYGLGFAVVAREIRRLADQTAVATLDIEQMVSEMQSAVSAGVMEMDKFSKEVQANVDQIRQMAQGLEEVIERVQNLSPRFEMVNEGMKSQSQGASQITDAMVQLSEAASQNAESLREFNNATEQLNEAAQGLQTAVSRFKVDE